MNYLSIHDGHLVYPHLSRVLRGDQRLAAAMITRAMLDLSDHDPALASSIAERHEAARTRGGLVNAAMAATKAGAAPTACETAFDWLNGAAAQYPFQLACDLLGLTPDAMRTRIADTLGCDYLDGVLLGNVNPDLALAFRSLPTTPSRSRVRQVNIVNRMIA